MEINLEYFRKIQNAYHTTQKKETDLYNVNISLEEHFADTPDYESDTLIDGIKQELIVISTKKDDENKIKSRPSQTFRKGQTVDCYGQKWLIWSVNMKKQNQTTGIMKLCNYTLEFQNPNGEIIAVPSVVQNASQYNSGVDENKTITLGSNQYLVSIPYNSDTLNLTYDRRLFIDNSYKIPYRVTRPDNVSSSIYGEGLILLIMSQDQLGENITPPDRPDLHICNYFTPITPPPINDLVISHLGLAEIKCGGQTKSFSVDNIETVTWTIIGTEFQLANITQTIIGNTIKLKTNNQDLVNTTITIKAETSDNQGELLVKILALS